MSHCPAVYKLTADITQSTDQQPFVQICIVEYTKGGFTFRLPTLNTNKQPEYTRIIGKLLRRCSMNKSLQLSLQVGSQLTGDELCPVCSWYPTI